MAKKLVIVESPAKAKTINRILGSDYTVTSSVGHVRDLPVKNLGVDVKDNFKPQYVIAKGKKKVIDQLCKDAKACDEIYLAPDPDREGEAIAWHIREVLEQACPGKRFHRIQYNEITKRAVLEAFNHAGELNMDRVAAQQARRVLDRLVGYMVSPILWRRVKRGLSAGRVQSVALRLVCEREREIQAFVPEAFWILGARVRKLVVPLEPFLLRLARIDGEKAEVKSEELAGTICSDLEDRALRVTKVEHKTVRKNPLPPFITSTLQQSASSRHGLSPARTMSLAQKLYEGVDFGQGPAGLITYMRTDSFSVAREAVAACRELIVERFGKEYCPEAPNSYKSRKGAQEAHEAIRPTDVRRTPDTLARYLDPAALKLYTLIWQRFVASQMSPARIAQRLVSVAPESKPEQLHEYLFLASASEVAFPGYMKASGAEADKKKEDEDNQPLPALSEGEPLICIEWLSERKETRPPARFSEASLVKALEANGVGRPSTYAQILSTLQSRQYATREKRMLAPTELGLRVNDLLVETLSQLFDVKFTASMEDALDAVEGGSLEWTQMLADFYKRFDGWLEQTREPPADMDMVGRVLTLLEEVREWAPPEKRGKRTFSDQRFFESIKKQLAAAERPISNRQHDALLRIALKYAEQIPEIRKVAELSRRGATIKSESESGPKETTLLKLSCLATLDLDESARKFIDSLNSRVQSGRPLSEAQVGALDKILIGHSAQIDDFETVSQSLGIEPAERTEDTESGELLEVLTAVKAWREPVTRGKRVFDDQKFFQSLAGHYSRKKFLSLRQRAALKRMVSKYRDQIPDYDRIAETYGMAQGQKKTPAD